VIKALVIAASILVHSSSPQMLSRLALLPREPLPHLLWVFRYFPHQLLMLLHFFFPPLNAVVALLLPQTVQHLLELSRILAYFVFLVYFANMSLSHSLVKTAVYIITASKHGVIVRLLLLSLNSNITMVYKSLCIVFALHYTRHLLKQQPVFPLYLSQSIYKISYPSCCLPSSCCFFLYFRIGNLREVGSLLSVQERADKSLSLWTLCSLSSHFFLTILLPNKFVPLAFIIFSLLNFI